jgi:ribonuclease-3
VSATPLGRAIGHEFQQAPLLDEALTHRSWANEHPGAPHNERLALLGDAALGLVVAERLWREEPAQPVGVLTPRRAELVSQTSLACWARQIRLGEHIRLGRGEAAMGGQAKESVLATGLEAVLGVVYLEGGLEAVRRAVARMAVW